MVHSSRQLLGVGIGETRVPRKGHGDGAPIHQLDTQCVRADGDLLYAFIGADRQNAHSMPPKMTVDVRPLRLAESEAPAD